jgi:uncharacterized protein
MKKIFIAVLFCIFASISFGAEPLHALLVTGGCCHDYEAQKKTLAEGISARANVTWTIIHEGDSSDKDTEYSIYKKPNWTKGFDVIVHNECAGKLTNVTWVEAIVREHLSNAVPAVMIHCSMHSYRDAETDEWRKLIGLKSMRHQQRRKFDVINVATNHPIMKSFPATWRGPAEDELYEVLKVWPSCTPLAKSATPGKPDNLHPSIWINQYGKCRVFGTTLGHLNETMQSDVYLDTVTRGLLWACDKLDKKGEPKKGYAKK